PDPLRSRIFEPSGLVSRQKLFRGGKFLDRAPKRRWIDRRIEVKPRLDLFKVAKQLAWLDTSSPDHLAHVFLVLRMTALDLGKRLSVKIVVIEGKLSLADNEQTPLLPAWQFRNKFCR